ncbi:MAG: TPM domain-containing protein [Fimbriimonadales bacterium]|nr:TPM domain-containing protein [Fimbriimonadales bacterium]
MRGISVLVGMLLLIGAWAQRVDEVPNPRQTEGGWVVDMAGILTPEQKLQLNEMIGTLERDTGAEMAVVILQRTVDAEPKEFATELFNRWGVGKKGEDNGILVLVALQQRRIEVETGYGIEGILPDSEVGTILQDVVVPAFRRGDYASGLTALVSELIQRIRDRSAGAYTPPEARRGVPVGSILGVILLAGGVGVILYFLLGERAPRCPTCRKPMRLLSEQQDNAYLNPLQLLEERLRSVDYKVWRCDNCQTLDIRPHVRWWSGYERCPKCGGRSLKTTSRVVREPTYRRAGLELIRKVCKNPRCDYEDEQQRTIPRRERSSTVIVPGGGLGRGGGWVGGSSSSGGWGGGWSGGGSFGGGSSGGGGAGAGW